MKLHKNYSAFFELLNDARVDWCLIKDYDFLMQKGYDNEIDVVALGKDRRTIRRLARSLGWHESTLNAFNMHLIFFKFEGVVPYRIDIHLDRVLATAVPWFNAEDILRDKMKRGDLWIASPKWELGILLLSSFRGRHPKPHRLKRAKELEQHLQDVFELFKGRMSEQEVLAHYFALINGKIVRLSKLKRIGVLGWLGQQWLNVLLFITRLFNPSPIIMLATNDAIYGKKVRNQLLKTFAYAKMHVEVSSSIFSRCWKRIKTDAVIVEGSKQSRSAFVLDSDEPVSNTVAELIQTLYPEVR